eukprot:6088049-Alexandrium_andersonii.AAC.1
MRPAVILHARCTSATTPPARRSSALRFRRPRPLLRAVVKLLIAKSGPLLLRRRRGMECPRMT